MAEKQLKSIRLHGLDDTYVIPSTAEEVGAAPAGYGLGGYSAQKGIATVIEIDDIKANGKYNINQTNGTLYLEGIAFNALNLEVSMINANYGTQVISFLDGYVIRRRCSNGIWQPWEWEIYPLTQGVEYRTTEKLNGSPVYKKRLSLGSLPASAGSMNVSVGIKADKLIECRFWAFDESQQAYIPIPYGTSAGDECSVAVVESTAYASVTTGAFGGYVLYAELRYIK